MTTNEELLSDWPIPPGEFLLEVIEDLGISQVELAKRMGRPKQMVNEIIKGTKEITPETALQIADVVGVPAHIWIGLESDYRLILAKQEDAMREEKEKEFVVFFPYLELSKLGLVKVSRTALEKVQELKTFFAVASLSNIRGVKEYAPAFRKVEKAEVSEEALASWLRAGHILANKQEVAEFSKQALLDALPLIRKASLEIDPNRAIETAQKLLSECGVSLVVIPHFPKTFVSGATFTIHKDRPVIMMSNRGSWADIFWFSLFHEIGHIVLHGKKETFLESEKVETRSSQEVEADEFAQKQLIPLSEYRNFVKSRSFSEDSIARFARAVGVHPGIVTGRLQHDKKLTHFQHYHRVRYKWSD